MYLQIYFPFKSGNISSFIEYNMTRSVTMTVMSNIVTSSTHSMSSGVMKSHTPSTVRMSNTASASVTPMSYNSSIWPTVTPSVSFPFVCADESCRQEIECKTSKLNIVVSNKKNPEVLPLQLRLNILRCTYFAPCHRQNPKNKQS